MTETKTAAKTTAFMKELTPSPELAAIVGTQPLPRTEVTKRIWDYVKTAAICRTPPTSATFSVTSS